MLTGVANLAVAVVGITYLGLTLGVSAGGPWSFLIADHHRSLQCVLLPWPHCSNILTISSQKSAICPSTARNRLPILSSRVREWKIILSSTVWKQRSNCRSFWEFQLLPSISHRSTLSLGSRPTQSPGHGTDPKGLTSSSWSSLTSSSSSGSWHSDTIDATTASMIADCADGGSLVPSLPAIRNTQGELATNRRKLGIWDERTMKLLTPPALWFELNFWLQKGK